MRGLMPLEAPIADEDLSAVELQLRRPDLGGGLLQDVAGAILRRPGKRLRPMLVLLAARACSASFATDPAVEAAGPTEKVLALACAIEHLHTATLLHDDVIDGASLRRGLPSAHVLFGPKEAVLAGDLLLSRALEAVLRAAGLDGARVLARATERLVRGETLDLEWTRRPEADEAQILAIYAEKTGALFAAAAALGALAASAPPEQRAALEAYGEDLGIAFQIADDVLDVVGDVASIGKAPGGDLREGKATLPVRYALDELGEASPPDAAFLARVVREAPADGADIARALALVADLGVPPARRRAGELAARAGERLRALPPSRALDALLEIAAQAHGRTG